MTRYEHVGRIVRRWQRRYRRLGMGIMRRPAERGDFVTDGTEKK